VRSEHPLISHVPVPALALSAVQSLPPDVQNLRMMRTFERWLMVDAEPPHASTPGFRAWLSSWANDATDQPVPGSWGQ